jgi:zinc and cadmium transporter
MQFCSKLEGMSQLVWLIGIGSALLVSAISLLGVMTFTYKQEHMNKTLIFIVSFSAGALFGDAFIHLIPEAIDLSGFEVQVSLLILGGIIVSFAIETFLQWRHCHIPTSPDHPHSFAYMNLFGDAIHNFIDGLIIGGSYLANMSLGITTTIAIILHEIPQEIGDFGVLLYGGFTRSRALLFNMLTALVAVLGTSIALLVGSRTQEFIPLLIPFAAGNFIYIAGSDLIPELHTEETDFITSAMQLSAFVLGILMLFALSMLE